MPRYESERKWSHLIFDNDSFSHNIYFTPQKKKASKSGKKKKKEKDLTADR